MNVLERIASYYSEKCNRKNEVLKECTLLAPEIFRILRSKYPYVGDIRIMNFGWIFRVVVQNKDNSGIWDTFVFPMNNLDYEFEDSPVVAFNNKLKAYMDWDREMENALYHMIKDNYQFLNRFLYKHGYTFNITNHIYQGDKYITFCTNGYDYVAIDCVKKEIIDIQFYDDFQVEMLEEKWENINNFNWDNLKRI
jgi:hypothetical protein